LLAKSIEILAQEGYSAGGLAREGGAPGRLFDIVTARRPEVASKCAGAAEQGDARCGGEVVSLFGGREPSQ